MAIMKYLSFHNDIKKYYTVQEIDSLINSYQRTIDTFTDQIRYYSNYSIFKKLADEAIKQGEELLDLLDCMKIMTEETDDKLIIDKTDFVPMSKKESEEIRKLWLDFLESQKKGNILDRCKYIAFVGKKLKEEKDNILDEMKVL